MMTLVMSYRNTCGLGAVRFSLFCIPRRFSLAFSECCLPALELYLVCSNEC